MPSVATKNRLAALADHKNGNGRTSTVEIASVPKLDIREFAIDIIGATPLVVHAWDVKTKRQIEEKQQKKAKGAKQARDPQAEYLASLYLMPDSKPAGTAKAEYGLPASGFKKAAVKACRYLDGINMTFAYGAFFVLDDGGGMIRLECSPPRMRTDMVRIGPQKTADVRYRGEFEQWKCKLRIRYNASAITAEQIVNLFHHAGFHIGWGDMRPEKGYSNGMWEVRTADTEKKAKKRQ